MFNASNILGRIPGDLLKKVLGRRDVRFGVVTTISFSRIILVLLLVSLPSISNGHVGPEWTAAFFFCLGGAYLTDIIDGHLARSWGVASSFGYVLDGYADRIFYFALVLMLVDGDAMPKWIALLILGRELAVYAVRSNSRHWQTKQEDRRHRLGSKAHAALLRLVLTALVVTDFLHQAGWLSEMEWARLLSAMNLCLLAAVVVSYIVLCSQFSGYAQEKARMRPQTLHR